MFLGVYWSERPESREQVAHRIAQFLAAIAAQSALFVHWFLKGRTKASARVPLESTPAAIAARLAVSRRDVGGDVMSELGFEFGVWNGEHASIAATIGAFSPHVHNSVVLSFDDTPQGIGRTEWKNMLDAAIQAFDPQHAVVTTTAYLTRTGASNAWDAGWFTYERGREVTEHPFASTTEPESGARNS